MKVPARVGKVEAHICQGSSQKGRIVPYPSFLCSMCMGRGAVEVLMKDEEIEEYNRKLEEKDNN